MAVAALGGCAQPAAAPGPDEASAPAAGTVTPPLGGPSVPAPQVVLPQEVMPAREPLRLLRQRVAANPDPALSGRYAHVRLRYWAADATLRPGGRSSVVMVEFVEERWRAADGSARMVTTRVPTRPGQPTVPQVTVFAPGGLPMGADPLPVDPPLLAAVMDDLHPPLMGGMAGLRAANDLAGWHTLTRDQRLALLTVLGDIDGLMWLGFVTDRAARRGIAVAYDQHGARDLLVLHPSTGQVLAYQHTAIPTPGRTSPPLPAETYELHLSHDRTPTNGTPTNGTATDGTPHTPVGGPGDRRRGI